MTFASCAHCLPNETAPSPAREDVVSLSALLTSVSWLQPIVPTYMVEWKRADEVKEFSRIVPREHEETAMTSTTNAYDSQPRFLGSFTKAAMRRASLEQLEPGVWYAEVAELPGVWAEGADMLECLHNLQDVIAEWVVLKVGDSDSDFPVLDGIDLNQI